VDASEKLRRALSDEWEFVGDPHSLCRLLRAEVLRLRLPPIEWEQGKRLVARCEANEVIFDNADMSAALSWGQQWMAETNRLRNRLEFLLGFDGLDDLVRDVITKTLEGR
jgi:hypothetical protein